MTQNKTPSPRQNQSIGFTLIELLIVIALVAIIAGVTADIVISLVRSYSKTKITNEIEQTANTALLKLEKELKTATSLSAPAVGSSSNTITFNRMIEGVSAQVTYEVPSTGSFQGNMLRSVDGGTAEQLVNTGIEGVQITNDDVFTTIQENPYVVRIHLLFTEANPSGGAAFTGDLELEQTIVLRGTYQ